MTRRDDPTPTTPRGATRELRWAGLSLRVPPDWGVIRHSPATREGLLAIADRRRQRLQVSWKLPEAEPDLDRLIRDHRAKQEDASPTASVRSADLAGGWRGTRRADGDAPVVTRAVKHDPATGRLLEAVAVDPPGVDPAGSAARLLAHVDVAEPADAVTRWRAFGLDVVAPDGWRLGSARVLPLDVRFRFVPLDVKRRSGGGPDTLVAVRRRAVASSWFRGDLRRLARREHRKTRLSPVDASDRGVETVALAGEEPAPRLKRWLGLTRVIRHESWLDADHDAVLSVEAQCPRKSSAWPGMFVVFADGPRGSAVDRRPAGKAVPADA